MFSTVVTTRKRPSALHHLLDSLKPFACQDIVVVVNDCPDTVKMLRSRPLDENIKIIALNQNIGAGRGKHRGIEAAQNNRVLVIDDDAIVLGGSDLDYCLNKLNDYSLVQGLILADSKKNRRSFEQPFWFRKNRSGDHDISYFVGAIHFINRDDFLAAGGYADAAEYGFEELELSLNLLSRGKRLLFTDKFRIHHKRDSGGRRDAQTVAAEMLDKRNQISAKYFPIPVALFAQLVWNIKLLPKARKIIFRFADQGSVFGYRDLIRNPRLLSRAFA